jgi:hypothetical protein
MPQTIAEAVGLEPAGATFNERRPYENPRESWTDEQKARHAAETNCCWKCSTPLHVSIGKETVEVRCDCGLVYPDHPWARESKAAVQQQPTLNPVHVHPDRTTSSDGSNVDWQH